MENDKMEQLHISVPAEMRTWVKTNKEKYGCDSINSFGRYIIREFRERQENNKNEQSISCMFSMSSITFILALLLPIFLFTMGRVNDNDIALYSIGIISLAGPVMLYRQR
jgi:hypothetical protein